MNIIEFIEKIDKNDFNICLDEVLSYDEKRYNVVYDIANKISKEYDMNISDCVFFVKRFVVEIAANCYLKLTGLYN